MREGTEAVGGTVPFWLHKGNFNLISLFFKFKVWPFEEGCSIVAVNETKWRCKDGGIFNRRNDP